MEGGQEADALRDMQAAFESLANVLPAKKGEKHEFTAQAAFAANALRAWRLRGVQVTDEQWSCMSRVLAGIMPEWKPADETQVRAGNRTMRKAAEYIGAAQDAAYEMLSAWRRLTAARRAVRRTCIECNVAGEKYRQRTAGAVRMLVKSIVEQVMQRATDRASELREEAETRQAAAAESEQSD